MANLTPKDKTSDPSRSGTEQPTNVSATSTISQVMASFPVNLSFSLKLYSRNYLMWNEQMRNVVFAYGLEEYLFGTTPILTKYLIVSGAQSVNPEFSGWNRYNNLLKNRISSSVSAEARSHLTRKPTATDMWVTLEKKFLTDFKISSAGSSFAISES